MNKQKKLQHHKNIATGLLLLMLCIYITVVFLLKLHPQLSFLGYIKAFAEAAMVGALADWFAVTALFRKPLNLNIPHTNLIEQRKKDIGDNLGVFVVDNFLTPQQIRPYITNINIASFLINWLSNDKNKSFITDNASQLLKKLVDNHKNTIETHIISQFPPIIPTFIAQTIAKKVTEGLNDYVITLSDNPTELNNTVEKLIVQLKTNEALQHKMNKWVQKMAYQFVLKNRTEVSTLISSTITNWEGRALSEKLELEVGKDLQFIRINGTLVGGLVGLLIYTLTQLL